MTDQPTTHPTGSAELRVGPTTADPVVAGARFHGGHCACDECMTYDLNPRGLHGGSDLDRHADALATLAASYRRVFIR